MKRNQFFKTYYSIIKEENENLNVNNNIDNTEDDKDEGMQNVNCEVIVQPACIVNIDTDYDVVFKKDISGNFYGEIQVKIQNNPSVINSMTSSSIDELVDEIFKYLCDYSDVIGESYVTLMDDNIKNKIAECLERCKCYSNQY